MSDLIMDFNKKYDDNYAFQNLFGDFEDILSDLNLFLLTEFNIWSRIIGLIQKCCLLDYIDMKDLYIY